MTTPLPQATTTDTCPPKKPIIISFGDGDISSVPIVRMCDLGIVWNPIVCVLPDA